MIGTKHGIFFAALALAAGSLAACGSSDNNNGPTPVSRLWVVSDSQAAVNATQRADYTAGKLYANAHTSANPNGDIRGQLDKEGTIKMAMLTGDQETPSVTTSGFGAGALSVDVSTGAARGFVLTSGLQNVTAAHIHQSSGRNVAGAVIVPLKGGPDVWVVPDGTTLDAGQIAAFQAGNLYYNVHTSANPNGEIRGQIDHSGTVRLASLNGQQEAPSAVTTNAYGGCMVIVDQASGKVAGFIISSGLSGTLAHIHQQARGQAGGVIVPMVGGPTLWHVADNQPAMTGPQITAFQQGNLYCNEHTAANPTGEIRGQLDKSGDVRLAAMDGAQETPATGSTATGAAAVSIDSGSGDVRGFFAVTGITDPTIAHIHDQVRGQSGGVIVPLGP